MLPPENVQQAKTPAEATTPTSNADQKQPASTALKQIRSLLGNQALGRAIEANPRVSEPGDQQEQDANRAADQVMRMDSAAGAMPTSFGDHSKTQDTRSEGRLLPPSVRSFFEPRLDHSLGHVRIHTGPDAAEAARQVDARAFTAGSDVVFGGGEYRPESHEGRRLIAHELAHVVQGARLGAPARIMREPAGETPPTGTTQPAPSTPAPAKPEPLRPESKFDWKLKDLLVYPLFADIYSDLIRKDLTEKERKELGLKGNEAAAYYVWAAAVGLPIGGLGGGKFEGGVSKGLTTWSNYVDAIQPLSLSDSAIMDGVSRVVGLRIDDYLGSDLFLMRVKTHALSVASLLLLVGGANSAYRVASGPGEVGEMDPEDWSKHLGWLLSLLGAGLKERFTAPDFFEMKPLQMKSHPAFASAPFAGGAPTPGFVLEGNKEVGGEGSNTKFDLTVNLTKFFTTEGGPTAKEMGDLQKYRGWQTSLWFNYNKLNPTNALKAVGGLPNEELKGGVIFGGGGHLGKLETGARYSGTAAHELTSWFIDGGFGYSDKKGSVVNRLGFTATYLNWTERDILAPHGEMGERYGGEAMKFTPFGKLEFGDEKHKFDIGAALSFVSGTKEAVGVSDLRADLSYTYMGDSNEEKLPQFKIDLSGSFNRLDWHDPRSPMMWGLQAKGSAGRAFGGVEVMTGAGKIPESRAAVIDKPEKVRVPTTLVVTGGWAF